MKKNILHLKDFKFHLNDKVLFILLHRYHQLFFCFTVYAVLSVYFFLNKLNKN